jgi:hypothetical protein
MIERIESEGQRTTEFGTLDRFQLFVQVLQRLIGKQQIQVDLQLVQKPFVFYKIFLFG